MPDDLEQARRLSIQSRAREGRDGPSFGLLLWLAGGNEIVSPWWSKTRDAQLRRFWRTVDYLSGAVYTMESRMKTVPFRVQARDMSIKAHVRQAKEFQRLIEEESEYGKGWGTFYSKFVEDLITQDNGAFAEVIGKGKPDGPIVGRPVGVANLDSWRCQRTSDQEFPVVYQDVTGKFSKLHWTRVMLTSQMPSSAEEMHDVGFCAVSRCLNIAQSLLDILIYKQEKLGSRPHRGIMITQGGLDPDDVKTAFRMAEERMDSQNLRRFSKVVVVGSDDIPDAAMQEIDLAGLPDGFDERDSVTLGMATISLAFGVDPRELFPGLQAGATRAEALIAHIKQRGKGPGDILTTTAALFNQKFLPPQLEMIFDFQDDAQDRSVAEIKNIRSERHVRDVTIGLVDMRTAREQMLADGDLTAAQFARLELEDGRLEDGSDVLTLFHQPDFRDLLDLEVENPLDRDENEAADMLEAIERRTAQLILEMGPANVGRRANLRQALAALERLKLLYGGISAEMTKPDAPEKRKPAAAAAEIGGEADTAMPPDLGATDLELKSDGRGDAYLVKAAEAIAAAADRIGTDGRAEELEAE